MGRNELVDTGQSHCRFCGLILSLDTVLDSSSTLVCRQPTSPLYWMCPSHAYWPTSRLRSAKIIGCKQSAPKHAHAHTHHSCVHLLDCLQRAHWWWKEARPVRKRIRETVKKLRIIDRGEGEGGIDLAPWGQTQLTNPQMMTQKDLMRSFLTDIALAV